MRTTLNIDGDVLALAVAHGARLVTLDKSVSLVAVRGANEAHLAVI